MLTPLTLVNNMPFYAKSAGHVTRPYQGILLPKSKYPGYEVDWLLADDVRILTQIQLLIGYQIV